MHDTSPQFLSPPSKDDMFTPASFVESDSQKIAAFIQEHSFGVLVTHDGHQSVATHLPLLLDQDVGNHGRLVGHMARANMQWQHCDGQGALVIFNGPHAYISPAWNDVQNAVPTWNYVAVHVYGTILIEHDHERLKDIVAQYVQFYEQPQVQPWSLAAPDAEFVDSLVDATVGFTIDIDRIEGKWKLSQNHTPARRSGVIDALRASERENDRSIADLMADTLADQTDA